LVELRDVTFFAGFDEITSPAFDESNPASICARHAMIEAKGGYIEIGYAYLNDTEVAGRSYHNIGVSYTRRYLNLFSNSMRAIVNTGQGGPPTIVRQTACYCSPKIPSSHPGRTM